MKDFLKIFFILIVAVASFWFGRNYGVVTVTETPEYKKLLSDKEALEKSEQELTLLKDKFQSLLDKADFKKADEILGQVMTIFLADLSLHLSDEKQKDFDQAKLSCRKINEPPVAGNHTTDKPLTTEQKNANSIERVQKNTDLISGHKPEKYKSLEWMLVQAQTDQEVLNHLSKVELKDIDSFLKQTRDANLEESKKLIGSYRGSVLTIDNQIYGSLAIDVKETLSPKGKTIFTGSLKLFRAGREVSSSDFSRDALGFTNDGFQGSILDIGRRYLQVYKVENNSKIAGYFYERLPQGTTKTIGHFLLTRVDQF